MEHNGTKGIVNKPFIDLYSGEGARVEVESLEQEGEQRREVDELEALSSVRLSCTSLAVVLVRSFQLLGSHKRVQRLLHRVVHLRIMVDLSMMTSKH